MGAGGAAALGVGGGLVGGMMLANAMDGDDDYQEGYQDGQQDDYGGGDDFGGGMMGVGENRCSSCHCGWMGWLSVGAGSVITGTIQHGDVNQREKEKEVRYEYFDIESPHDYWTLDTEY